jgi:hypothetical protein
MYGVFHTGEPARYFACLRLTEEDPDDLGFERATVPGGPYGRRLISQWSSRIPELPAIVDALMDDLVAAGYRSTLLDPKSSTTAGWTSSS